MLCDSYSYSVSVTRDLILEQHMTYLGLATTDKLMKATQLMFLDSRIAAIGVCELYYLPFMAVGGATNKSDGTDNYCRIPKLILRILKAFSWGAQVCRGRGRKRGREEEGLSICLSVINNDIVMVLN